MTHDVDPDRSVTCVLCGDLADERETVPISDDPERLGHASLWDSPERVAAQIVATARYGAGEAHQACFAEFWEQLTDTYPAVLPDDPRTPATTITLHGVAPDELTEMQRAAVAEEAGDVLQENYGHDLDAITIERPNGE